MDEAARIFEEHRNLLGGIAYRMCGVLADAQDIVQETWLRWRGADHSGIREPRAWLITACSRLAMDLMKSARVRRETYVGTWLPEPFLDDRTADPAERMGMDDTISMALMLALENLSPAERAAFLLHDVFGCDFAEIAGILGKSEAACRKLASRARMSVRASPPRFEASPEEHRLLLQAFFDAANRGELQRLKSLLAEGVELCSDGGGRVATAPEGLRGRDAVARFFAGVWRGRGGRIRTESRRFNGGPGMLVHHDGELVAALSIDIENGAIRRIYALRNPDKLEPFAAGRRAASRTGFSFPASAD